MHCNEKLVKCKQKSVFCCVASSFVACLVRAQILNLKSKQHCNTNPFHTPRPFPHPFPILVHLGNSVKRVY